MSKATKEVIRPPATAKQIKRARDLYVDNDRDIEVDDDAVTSVAEDGTGVWVQAWVWLPAEEGGAS